MSRTTKDRTESRIRLNRLGITGDDAAALIRAEAVLHTWAEHECNGTIQRDEETGIPYWWTNGDHGTPRRLGRTSDREAGARARAQAIAERYGFTIYHQTDPRGAALYLLRPGDVPDGVDAGACYSRGICV